MAILAGADKRGRQVGIRGALYYSTRVTRVQKAEKNAESRVCMCARGYLLAAGARSNGALHRYGSGQQQPVLMRLILARDRGLKIEQL